MQTYEVILHDVGIKLTVVAHDTYSAQKKAKIVYKDKIGRDYKGNMSAWVKDNA